MSSILVVAPPLLVALPLAAALFAFMLPALGRYCTWLAAAGIIGLLALLAGELPAGAVAGQALGGWPAPLGIRLAVDGLALWLLWMTALVGVAVSLYGPGYFAAEAERHFHPLWLGLWAALNGVLLAADLFNIYVCLELLGLAAVALTALAGTPAARSAALRYLLLNLGSSLCLLLAVVIFYRQSGSLGLEFFYTPLGDDLLPRLGLAFWTLALLLKAALFPLHFWLPPAHANAPAPVSAILSALVVKAAFYLLLRSWLPLGSGPEAGPAGVFSLFGLLGAAAIGWGAFKALGCDRLKPLIAYSTVAQVGYFFLFFPLLGPAGREAAGYGLLFLLFSHALAKAALFLAAGAIILRQGSDRLAALAGLGGRQPLAALALALAGISLMGLPPSGGFIGKWYFLQAAIQEGRWGWAVVLLAGGLLTLAYLLRPLALTFATPRGRLLQGEPCDQLPAEAPLAWLALGLALAAILLGIFPFAVLRLLGGGLP